ncbi:hypothetical protein yc1106_07140 [Curvularia clavata]|uniref:Uncharacterized protein n=1 Tax=Curvularia clavata TaxID=95742 RepID=A0A9Q9DVX0_CURCL|nr:hypothetical protein yc1106_07140 [Curvularia clavata]
MMGSEWHPRRHPQPDQNHYTQRSLPSFAELTSSSTDSLLHRPRASVPPPPPPHALPLNTLDRPASRSSPPKSISSAEFANPPVAPDRAAFTPINHASPHVSPTNTRAPPAVPQHQTYSHSLPHTTAAAPYSPPLSSGPLPALHDTAPSQTTSVNARQDSAIAQQPYDHPKDTEPSLPSSVLAFSYFHPPGGNRRQSTSRPASHPVGPSSPHSPPGETRTHQTQPPPETAAHGLRSLHPPAQSPGTQFPPEPTRSPPHTRGPPATTNTDSGFRNPLPSPTLDQTNGTGRHQRYNVRFNTVYTSENMPPNQKPRNDPPPTAPTPAEPTEEQKSPSEQTVRPSVEPVTPSAVPRAQSPEEQPLPPQQTVPQLERCKGCGEPWRRPLPGEDQFRQSSPARNMGEQLALTQDFIKRLENHAKFADEAELAWKRKHQWCVAPQQPTSPPATEPPTETRNKSEESHSPVEAPAPQTHSAKRKSEVPHEASKYRKVANFEPQSNATPPVRPTAPA